MVKVAERVFLPLLLFGHIYYLVLAPLSSNIEKIYKCIYKHKTYKKKLLRSKLRKVFFLPFLLLGRIFLLFRAGSGSFII